MLIKGAWFSSENRVLILLTYTPGVIWYFVYSKVRCRVKYNTIFRGRDWASLGTVYETVSETSCHPRRWIRMLRKRFSPETQTNYNLNNDHEAPSVILLFSIKKVNYNQSSYWCTYSSYLYLTYGLNVSHKISVVKTAYAFFFPSN